jgi:integrase
VKRPAYERRATRLTPNQYKQLGLALRATEASGANEMGLAAIRLLALTGCRKGEILNLRWAEVDADNRAFRLADSKEGASVRPVGLAVIELLSKINRRHGSTHVVPAKQIDGPFGGLPRIWRQVVERACLVGVTPHTLRHSFASVAGDLGYSDSTIAALLGHAAGTVTGRYTHILDKVLVSAADHIAGQIKMFMEDEPPNTPAIL